MIYVDAIQEHRSGKWCHMWTDGDESELHKFAQSIGLRRSWAQVKPGFIIPVHYDLRPSKRDLALKAGAQPKPVIEYMREVNDRMLKADSDHVSVQVITEEGNAATLNIDPNADPATVEALKRLVDHVHNLLDEGWRPDQEAGDQCAI